MPRSDAGPGARHELARVRAAERADGRRQRKVSKAGVAGATRETINIGAKTTTARGSALPDAETTSSGRSRPGMLTCLEEERDKDGNLKKVVVEATRYVESDTALVNRVLGREVGGKQNILVLNDEAHHAYRIRRDEPDDDEEDAEFGEDEEAEEFCQGGDGLDRRARPHPQAPRHQLLRRSVGDAVLPRPRRAGHEPALPVGRQRLRPDRRDRVGPGEDPAARRARHDRRGDAGLLQHLALDPAASSPPAERGGKRANPKPEAILK